MSGFSILCQNHDAQSRETAGTLAASPQGFTPPVALSSVGLSAFVDCRLWCQGLSHSLHPWEVILYAR